jgi:hypothetical protein
MQNKTAAPLHQLLTPENGMLLNLCCPLRFLLTQILAA